MHLSPNRRSSTFSAARNVLIASLSAGTSSVTTNRAVWCLQFTAVPWANSVLQQRMPIGH
jgi:hypothetical protein